MKKFKSKKLKLIGIGVVIGLLIIVGVIFSIQIAVNSLISKQDNKEYQSINNSYLKSQNVLNLNATQINHNNEYEFNSSQIKLQTFDLNNPKITIDFHLKDENNKDIIHNEVINSIQSKMFISTWNYNLYQEDIKPLYKTYYFSNTKEIVFTNNQIENIALLTQQLTYIPSIKFSDNEVYYQLDLDTSNLNNFQTINQFLIDNNLNQHQQQTIFSLIPTKLMFLIDKNSNPNLIFKNNSIYHQQLLSQQIKTYTLNSQDILKINPKSQFMYDTNQKSIDFKIVSDLELKEIIELIKNNKEIVYNGNHNLNAVIQEFVKNINQITSDINNKINNTDLDAMHLKVENKTIANLKKDDLSNEKHKNSLENIRKNYDNYLTDPKLYKEYLVNKQQHNGVFYHFKELLKPNQYYDYDNNNFYFHNQNKYGGNPTKDLMKQWLNNYQFTNFNDFLHQHFKSKINSKGGGGDIVNIYWFDIKEYWEYIAPTFANNNEQVMYLLMFLYHIIYNSSFNTIEDQNLRYTPQEINEQIDYILHQIYFLVTNDPNSFIKFVNENVNKNNKVFTFNQKNSILYQNDNVIDTKNHTQTDINLYVKYLINQLSPYWISLIIKNPDLSIDNLKNQVLQLIIDTITSKYYHLQSTKTSSKNFDKIQDLKNTLLSSTNIKNSEDIYGFILNTVLNQKYHQYTFKDDVNLLIKQIQNMFKKPDNKNDDNSIHNVLNQYLKDIKDIKEKFTNQINQKTNLEQLNLKVDNVILDYNKEEKFNYIIKNPLQYTPKSTNEFNKLLNYEYEISTKTYEINYDAYINQIDLSSIDTLLKQKEYQYAILYSQNKESVSHLFNLINYQVYHPKYKNEDLGFYQQLYNLVYDYFKNDNKSISGKDVINYLQKYIYQPINNFYLNYPFNELNNPLESTYFNQIDYSFDYNNQLYLDTIFSGIQDYQSKLDPNSLIKTYQQLYQKQDFEFFYLDERQFKYLYNQNTIISNQNVYINVIDTQKDETKYENTNEINTINFNLHHHDFVAFYDFTPLTKHQSYGDFLLKIINSYQSYQPILYENSDIDTKTFNDFDKNTQEMFNQVFLEYTNTKNNLKKIVNDSFNLKIYVRQKLYLNDYASISDDIIENYIYNDNNKSKIVNTNQYINNIYKDYDWEFSNDDFKFINYELINNHINSTNNIKLNKTITNNFNYFNNPNFENEIKNTKGLIISNLTKTNNINNLSHTTRDLYNLEYLGTSGGFNPIYNNLNHNKNNNSSKVKFDYRNYYEVDDIMYNSFGFNKVSNWGFGYVIGQEKYTIFYVLNHNKGAYTDPNHVFVRTNSVHMFDNKNHYLGFNTKNNITIFDFNNPYSDKSFIDYFKNLNNTEIFKNEYKPISITASKLNVNFSFSNDK